MILHTLALVVAIQQAAQDGAKPSPIARIVVTPAQRTVIVGDTLRLRARALDANGNSVPGARILFGPAGGFMEGSVDTTGLVHSGSTGVMPIAVVAIAPGAKPVVERIEIRLVPGPAARVAISPRVTRLAVGQRIRLKATSFSKAGDERRDRVTWKSSAPSVLRVSDDGVISALAAGRAQISATAGSATSTIPVEVSARAIATVSITPARADARTGDVIRFKATARDRSGKEIEGLTPTWTFSPGSGLIDEEGAFVAYERGEYLVSASYGNHGAEATVRVERRDAERKATVLGRLPRTEFLTGEVWVHPNGRNAYLTTVLGGDRWYALDITNPSKPVVTDSVMVNARTINDIMTTADGKYLVFTREGADDRKNGIVIASVEDPAHPKPIAEFTDGVTAGVHSAFVYTQPKHGTHVYLTNDGTGALNIVDINDPHHPKKVGEWRTVRPDAGRTLHDVDVQDGLAYLAYWNDGLVILDVGNGMRGGSPSDPKLVSQYKYDLNELYREAEIVNGPGFIRGTHTAWRHKNYVFVGDEVFPLPTGDGFDFQTLRAFGRLHVVDVSDIEHPRTVAWYEPEYGGVHNVWVAGDTLYMGAYNAGFHAFDISGELRGDLRAQGREIADVNTADLQGKVPNRAMAWGAVVKNGLVYVNDVNNGLWVVKIEPKAVVP